MATTYLYKERQAVKNFYVLVGRLGASSNSAIFDISAVPFDTSVHTGIRFACHFNVGEQVSEHHAEIDLSSLASWHDPKVPNNVDHVNALFGTSVQHVENAIVVERFFRWLENMRQGEGAYYFITKSEFRGLRKMCASIGQLSLFQDTFVTNCTKFVDNISDELKEGNIFAPMNRDYECVLRAEALIKHMS